MRRELRRHQSANKQLEEKGFPVLVLRVELHVRDRRGHARSLAAPSKKYSVEILQCHVAQTERSSAQVQAESAILKLRRSLTKSLPAPPDQVNSLRNIFWEEVLTVFNYMC
jgi:hypothetical protein